MKTDDTTSSNIEAARLFLEENFPVLFSPLIVSVDKTAISSIRYTREYTQWKLDNPTIEHDYYLDIAIAQIIRSPIYYARLCFTSKFELSQVGLRDDTLTKIATSSLNEITKRLKIMKSNHEWYVEFTSALMAICQHHKDIKN